MFDVDLHVRTGEIVTIIGHNGAGQDHDPQDHLRRCCRPGRAHHLRGRGRRSHPTAGATCARACPTSRPNASSSATSAWWTTSGSVPCTSVEARSGPAPEPGPPDVPDPGRAGSGNGPGPCPVASSACSASGVALMSEPQAAPPRRALAGPGAGAGGRDLRQRAPPRGRRGPDRAAARAERRPGPADRRPGLRDAGRRIILEETAEHMRAARTTGTCSDARLRVRRPAATGA